MKLLSIVTLFSIFFIAPTQSEWKLKKNKVGIKVYTRNVQGSNFKAFKAMGELDGSVATVMAVFQDIDNLKNWMPKTKLAKQLKKINSTEEIRYLELAAPWPIANRDVINNFRFLYNPKDKSVKISVTSLHDYIPKKKGIVRIRDAEGYYLITPQANGKVKFFYQFHSEPGGNIPSWLANTSVVEIPFQTIVNLRKEVKKKKYQGKTFEFMN